MVYLKELLFVGLFLLYISQVAESLDLGGGIKKWSINTRISHGSMQSYEKMILQMKETFKSFARGKSGTELSSKEVKAWFIAAKLLSAKVRQKCTAYQLDFAYNEVKGNESLTSDKMETLVEKMKKSYAADHKMTEDAAKIKIIEELGIAKVYYTGTKEGGGVGHIVTDSSKYTGADKDRFDADGKGKGIAGSETKVDNTGYTAQYKGADNYDKKP